MARDPVCGSVVDPNATREELALSIRGQTYYFCSIRCRLEFEEERMPALLRKPQKPALRKPVRANGAKPRSSKAPRHTCGVSK
ncbi:MAG: YHS domain-containing protein [bacterium JZ-2024 1]